MVDKPLIAVDIDDTIADSSEALRLEVNRAYDVDLSRNDYYVDTDVIGYYDRVWENAGLQVSFEGLTTDLSIDQSHIKPIYGVVDTIKRLRKDYRIVIVTSRDIEWKAATDVWVKNHFGDLFETIYLTDDHLDSEGRPISKGELCKRLGAKYLIDDNPHFCLSAREHGIIPIMFGDYGWQQKHSEEFPYCSNWSSIDEILDFVS